MEAHNSQVRMIHIITPRLMPTITFYLTSTHQLPSSGSAKIHSGPLTVKFFNTSTTETHAAHNGTEAERNQEDRTRKYKYIYTFIFHEMREDDRWCYVNCAMSSGHNPDKHFNYPPAFAAASRKYIIIREFWAGLMNAAQQVEYGAGNILVHADFVQDKYCGSYICLSNSNNMKKKKFRILGSEPGFNIAFSSISGNLVIPDDWVFDFLLKYKA
jgi:hypothetical protein